MRRVGSSSRDTPDRGVLDPSSPQRGSSKLRLLLPLVIASAVIICIYLLSGPASYETQTDNSSYKGKAKNPILITGKEFFTLPPGDKQLHYVTGGDGEPLYILVCLRIGNAAVDVIDGSNHEQSIS
jgi:hypothetical protein